MLGTEVAPQDIPLLYTRQTQTYNVHESTHVHIYSQTENLKPGQAHLYHF